MKRRRRGRRRTPAQKILAARKAKLEASRTRKIRPGTRILYRGDDGRPLLTKVVRQTATGRVTVKLPSGALRSIKPGLKR